MHWAKTSNANEITLRRIETRKQNDKLLHRNYSAWNKGLTGIYSEETRKKISDAALKQFSEKKFKKTNVEKVYESILNELEIEYIYSYIFQRRQFDFYIPSCKLIIEIQGDFWHGNPEFWGDGKKHPLREHQKMKRLDDKIKKALVESSGFMYIEFWEHNIMMQRNEILEATRNIVK